MKLTDALIKVSDILRTGQFNLTEGAIILIENKQNYIMNLVSQEENT